jgi:nitroimidazol reductase NimA-like FMN-containing flavoprotein (pyridoxamine 5'-phosphate oxidase superfamily)
VSLQMTRVEREAFLADVHVGVLSLPEPGRGPLTVPIWYAYDPGGELRIVTGRDSRKGRLLAGAERVSLCAQTEAPPYRYVSVEGPIAHVGPVDRARDVLPLAVRYLGPELGEQYLAATAAGAGDEILVRIRPERWLTVDYRKQFGG